MVPQTANKNIALCDRMKKRLRHTSNRALPTANWNATGRNWQTPQQVPRSFPSFYNCKMSHRKFYLILQGRDIWRQGTSLATPQIVTERCYLIQDRQEKSQLINQ